MPPISNRAQIILLYVLRLFVTFSALSGMIDPALPDHDPPAIHEGGSNGKITRY